MNELDEVQKAVLLQFPKRPAQDRRERDQGRRQRKADSGKKSPSNLEHLDEHAKQALVINAANKISSFVQSLSRELRFYIDNNSEETDICVWDKNTNQLIRRIPAEEAILLSEKLRDGTKVSPRGVLIDKEV